MLLSALAGRFSPSIINLRTLSAHHGASFRRRIFNVKEVRSLSTALHW
jgi:hypothetical protein